MPERIDPRGQDNPSTYFVEDRSSNSEMLRLLIQDKTITAGMGGPLAEQPDSQALRRVLDVGCGPGGWTLEAARLYPHMDLVGIDISWRMIEYARAQAQAQGLSDGVQFLVMDAMRPLEFPDNSFDLVNLRLASSFLLTKDWPRLLHELLRVTRPGGVIRVTDATFARSNSTALMRLTEMLMCAFYRSDHTFTQGSEGITSDLERLLQESGCQHVQSQDYTLEYFGGTVGGQNFYQDMMYAYQTLVPFLQKWGCAPDNYDAIYQQAMIEMQQKDFHATWKLVTVWGTKPQPVE